MARRLSFARKTVPDTWCSPTWCSPTWWLGRDRLRGVRLPAEARREGEGAAAARRAVHGDRPAHQSDQPGSDGQAQAGAAVLTRGRGVLLLEGPEDPLLLVGRDADAGVAHCEAEADFPRPRETAEAQPAGVAHQGIGHVRLHLVD